MNREYIKTLSDRRAVRMVALALLVLIFTVFLFQTYHKANRANGYDFTSYLLSAEALVHGENPYQTDTPFTYIYPMFLAFALIPLSVIPYGLANFVWYLFNVGSLLGAIVVLVRLSSESLKTNWGAHLLASLVLSGLFLLPIIQNNLLNGQVNFPVLFLCVLFLKYYSERRMLPASVFLALASAIKLVPLIFLMFLLLRKEFRMLGLSIGLFFVFCLAPIIMLGNEVFSIYGEYAQNFLVGKFSGGAAGNTDQAYFTLSGFVSQVLPWLKGWTELKLLCAMLVTIAVAVVEIQAMRRLGKAARIWTFNLYLLAILLITPLSETHHLAFLTPLFVLLAVRLFYDMQSSVRFYGTALTLFILCFYLGRSFDGPFYFSESWRYFSPPLAPPQPILRKPARHANLVRFHSVSCPSVSGTPALRQLETGYAICQTWWPTIHVGFQSTIPRAIFRYLKKRGQEPLIFDRTKL